AVRPNLSSAVSFDAKEVSRPKEWWTYRYAAAVPPLPTTTPVTKSSPSKVRDTSGSINVRDTSASINYG
ncbi:unnamed protein product, partial [Polarella glacialis]